VSITSRTRYLTSAGFALRVAATASSMIDSSYLGRHVGKFAAGFGHGLVEHAPLDGFLDEFREIAFLHAPLGEKTAHRDVGVLGHRDGPAGGVLGHGASC
jgi:hypothetical protein